MNATITTGTAETTAPLPISADAAVRRQDNGALLIDVRPQVARHQGSITGAVVIDPAAVPQLLAGSDVARDIIVCNINTRRAMPVAEHLSRLGYRNVYYLAGGYGAWARRATA